MHSLIALKFGSNKEHIKVQTWYEFDKCPKCKEF